MSKTIIAIIIIIIVAGLGYWFYQSISSPEEEAAVSEGSKDCVNDDDCVVFGKTGDCNCGCYNKDNLPSGTGGECFCAAPTSCRCVDGKCEGVFEEEVTAEEKEISEEQGVALEEDEGEIPKKEEKEAPKEEEEKPTPTVTQLTFLEDLAADPSWSPNGSQLVFLGLEKNLMKGGLYTMNSDGTGVTKIAGQWGREHLFNPSWNPVDNRIVGHGMENNGLFLVDLDGDQTKRVQLTTQKSEMPSWSPDGKKIAYNVYNEAKSFSSIWVMDADGSGKTQLTTEEDGFCTGPSFSYDGSKIVYLKGFTSYAPESKNRPPNEIWVMNSDGSNKHMIYAPGDSSQVIRERAWNKNDKIVFTRHKLARGFPQIWIINSDGTNPQSIIEPPVGSPITIYDDPVWDNGGTKVAVTKVIGSSGDIWQVATFSWGK